MAQRAKREARRSCESLLRRHHAGTRTHPNHAFRSNVHDGENRLLATREFLRRYAFLSSPRFRKICFRSTWQLLWIPKLFPSCYNDYKGKFYFQINNNHSIRIKFQKPVKESSTSATTMSKLSAKQV